MSDIYGEQKQKFLHPRLTVAFGDDKFLFGVFSAIERKENELQVKGAISAKSFTVQYFGINPKKLIIINNGTITEIHGTICFDSFEYQPEDYRYNVVLGVKNGKFIRT